MKSYIKLSSFIVLIFTIHISSNAQILSQDDATILAKEWMKGIKKVSGKENLVIKQVKAKKFKEQPSFYAVNFENGGYVLIDAETGDHPIISYSKSLSFDEDQLGKSEKLWIDCVCNNIENTRKFKKESLLKSAKIGSTLESRIDEIQSQFQMATTTVPSLFESKQTSRWAYWLPYAQEFPNQNAENCCVPLAMAQIMKYYRFPVQGVGSHGGTDFSKEWFDFTQMPFRLTYCGNGFPNCNEGSFDILPGITDVNKKEISNLIYKCAIAVDMQWNGGGTFGNPGDWVGKMSQYFNYSSNWTFCDFSYISNNKETFKASLRNELINGRPILFNYIGPNFSHSHALVIDGVENDNYFHFATGDGGYLDAYYYLFDYDSDGIHSQSPYYTYYRAAYGIIPNCSTSNILNLNNITISIGMNTVYQANDKIDLSNFIVDGDGTNGGRLTLQAQNEINFNSGFEVKTGAEIFIVMQKCGIP
jgi:hypothetical protein